VHEQQRVFAVSRITSCAVSPASLGEHRCNRGYAARAVI